MKKIQADSFGVSDGFQTWCYLMSKPCAKFHYVQIFTSNRITSQMKILRNDIIVWYSDNLCANALLNKSPKIIAATKIYAVSVTGIFLNAWKY